MDKLLLPQGRLGLAALGIAALGLSACSDEQEPANADPAPPVIVLEGERLFPESITSDAAGNIYVGSNPGLIFRTSAGSESAPVWIEPNEENGLQNVFGVLADDGRGLLWVCSNPQMGGEGSPMIVTFSLEDGSLQARYPFPDDGPSMCNDMTVAANGDVYASEMLGGRILKLANGASEWEVFAVDEKFATIDGIALAEDGTLYANAIQRNNLLRVDVDADSAFAGVTVLTPSQEMAGPDGLRLVSGNTFVQSEGNSGLITLVTIEGDNAQIEVLASGVDYASSVTPLDGRVFYPEGKLSYMFDPNKQMQDPGEFRVFNVALPGGE